MKRCLFVLTALSALLLAVAASPALAGGLLPGIPGGSQTQSVSNSTSQSNEAGALNVPILSGNNVALINTGGQDASAGTTQGQANVNGTSQSADQQGGGDPAQVQSTSNSTGQSNQADAVNVPIASGNNLALVNLGGQNASAGTTQGQANLNQTKQDAGQRSGSWSDCRPESQWGGRGDYEAQLVSNRTDQSNQADAVNVPIASGNNLALINLGGQSSSAGVSQGQLNLNQTTQHADQAV
jgi:hypothetical protein